MTNPWRAFGAAALLLIQVGSASALPKDPIFCDTLHIKTCRPPAEMGGVYPHCFCSDATRPTAPGRRGMARPAAPSCTDICLRGLQRCTRGADTCRHQICDEDGFAKQQAALEACRADYNSCVVGCAQEGSQ